MSDAESPVQTLPIRVQEAGTTLMTKRDIAERAGVSERTVERWVSSGDLPCLRRGRWLRFTEAMYERFLRESKRQARG